jgi:hypothetical protein
LKTTRSKRCQWSWNCKCENDEHPGKQEYLRNVTELGFVNNIYLLLVIIIMLLPKERTLKLSTIVESDLVLLHKPISSGWWDITTLSQAGLLGSALGDYYSEFSDFEAVQVVSSTLSSKTCPRSKR